MDKYKTVKREGISEIVERRSKFIGYVKPVFSENEATSFLDNIKSKHWDAKHNVYAYYIFSENISRYSDDGEPHGTAGLPILDIIKKNNLGNIIVVVTRYFGGALLGTGGLVRAYSSIAKLAIDNAGIVDMVLCFKLWLSCDYNIYKKIISALNLVNARVEKTDFLSKVEVVFYVDKLKFDILSKTVCDVSSGSVKVNILEEGYFSL